MIDIFVPVLGRADQIARLAESLQSATLNEHQLICICTPGDDDAIEMAREYAELTILTNWPAGRADYAKKLALAYMHTEGEWFFQGATDLIFHAGWDAAALLAAKRHRKLVIGTNDLGNPLVKRGQHSTHSLIARSYIENYGGVVDGTGTIFSEAYDHQWSDSEFIETAKRRGQFISAKASIVEHLHPHWGKAEDDETYKKAHRATRRDMAIFMRRRALVARGARRR